MLIPLKANGAPLKLDTPNKQPKAATKASPKPRQTRSKTIVDDTLTATATVKEMFSKYNWRVVTEEEELIKYVQENKELGFDTETTGLFAPIDKLTGFSLGVYDFEHPERSHCIYVPLAHKVGKNYTGDVNKLGDILKETALYGFNFKFDALFFKMKLGVKLHCKWDAYLGARVGNSSEEQNTLKWLYNKYIDPTEEVYSLKSLFNMNYEDYDPELVGGYGAVDAMKHFALCKYQMEHPAYPAVKEIMEQIEIPLTDVLIDVCSTGIAVNFDACNELIASLSKDIDDIKKRIAQDWGDVNLGSPKQVAELLYDKLGLPQVNGRSTSEETLLKLDHPVVQDILKYREATKGLGTYAQKMPEWALPYGDPKGRLYYNFNQIGADTGRMSSDNPNMQNIPRDNRYRAMFKASDGMTMMSCDYSQQEIVVLAALCGDEKLIDACKKGLDFYQLLASEVYNLPYEDCSKKGPHKNLRNEMKSVALGLNYDMSIASLAKTIKKTEEEAKHIYNAIYDRFPGIKTFREKVQEQTRKDRYTYTITGRRRYFPELDMKNYTCPDKEIEDLANQLKDKAMVYKLIEDAKKEGIIITDNTARKKGVFRQFVNTRIQGTAAEMTKLAMIYLHNDPFLKEHGARILLQVHDEVIMEAPDEYAKACGDRMAELMIKASNDLIGIAPKCDTDYMKIWQKF